MSDISKLRRVANYLNNMVIYGGATDAIDHLATVNEIIGQAPVLNEPEYDGNDMASYMMTKGFNIMLGPYEYIKSITNVRNTAIIVTDYNIWMASPRHGVGFCLERMCRI